MRITGISIYVPEPSLRLASDFYAALLDTFPRHVQNCDDPYFSMVTTALAIEVRPAVNCPHTTMRIELAGEAEAAVKRVSDRVHAAIERTADRSGWWTTDPGGNTVVFLNSSRGRNDASPTMRRFDRGDLVRIAPKGKVYRVIRYTRDGQVQLSADADHPAAATRLPAVKLAYDPNSLIPVMTDPQN